MLINVKFIVTHDDNKGKISNNRISNQINVLNEAFGKQHELGIKSKINFKLLNIIYVNDKSLYNSGDGVKVKEVKKYPGNTKKYITAYTCNDDYLDMHIILGMKKKDMRTICFYESYCYYWKQY